MAKADVIANQLVQLENATENFERLLSTLMDVGGSDVPPWVLVMHDASRPLVVALDALAKGVRQVALPHLRDVDRINGGMGAVAPMVTKAVAGQSTPSRT